jgi:hypothetical protein
MISTTITKKLLETIVHETFSKFGSISCSSLLDSLKLLGFSYATSAGISISIEDLKTPNSKKEFLESANNEINQVSKQWGKGELSDTERFQTIIDNWNIATESLKNRIIEYYKNYDPINNLYVMAFSGARGNMAQVRQLVGMRGLMADQEGNIIDLPIQTNFREGLSPIDYIISSYGARKGIVDTALKTADSGYLTRRLIYIGQDLVIRQKDCGTKNGLIFLFENSTSLKSLIGRYLISIVSSKSLPDPLSFVGTLLDETKLNELKKFSPLVLNLGSVLTCNSNGSICQNCYGWDLAQGKKIALGEAVGIIAAQSIGEPGTQLTMRTFHTGGIFTGELLTQISAPFSGRVFFPDSTKSVPYRTSQGKLVSKLQQEISLILINWCGNRKEIFLDMGSFLYVSPLSFLKKGELIAEFMNQSVLPGGRKLKPVFSPISGEIRFENLLVRKIFGKKKVIKVSQDDGVLWIAAGKIIVLPKEAKTIFSEIALKQKPFSSLFFHSPFQGFFEMSQSKISLLTNEKRISLNLQKFQFFTDSTVVKLSLFLKNFQYVDRYTVLGSIHFFSKYEGKIYLIRKKDSKYKSTFFLVTEDDIWKINCNEKPSETICEKKRSLIKPGSYLTQTLLSKYCGILLKIDGFKMIFQSAFPIFLSRGAILRYKQGDFLFPKQILANLVNYIQQTEDIVQGLPKIEELIEARKPKRKSYLALRPGVFIHSSFVLENRFEGEADFRKTVILHSKEVKNLFSSFSSKKKQEKQKISIAHSIFLKTPFVLFRNQLYKVRVLPIYFKLGSIGNKGKGNSASQGIPFAFRVKNGKKIGFQPVTLFINEKPAGPTWSFDINFKENENFYRFEQNQLTKEELGTEAHGVFLGESSLEIQLPSPVLQNKKGDLIIFLKKKGPLFLEFLNPVEEYEIPLIVKTLFSAGEFIDIGEPFTEGIIDIHELLHILFHYHATLDNLITGSLKGTQKFQLLLVNSIQAIYQSQGVNISSKHIEIIVRQMTSKVVVKESGDTPYLPGELIRFSLIHEVCQSIQFNKVSFKIPEFEPLLLSATNASLAKDGFLSSAGFQETKRVLTKAAMEGTSDWLRGLKECIIIGRIIPAGSAFLNYKNYLDNIYLFQKKKI